MFFIGYITRIGVVRSYGMWSTIVECFKVISYTDLPLAVFESLNSPTSWITLDIVLLYISPDSLIVLLYLSLSSSSILDCGFHLHFLAVEHLFMCLLAIWIYSFVKWWFKSFACISIGFSSYFLLIDWSSLYSLSPLPNICIIDIFSTLAFLFPLLLVSF